MTTLSTRRAENAVPEWIVKSANEAIALVDRAIARRQSATPSSFQSIRKAAVEERPDLSEATAIRTYLDEHPGTYARYRAAQQSEPVAKAYAQSAAERDLEVLAAREREGDPSLSPEMALSRASSSPQGRVLMRDYREGWLATMKAASGSPPTGSARPALIGKASDSYAELERVAESLRRADPALTAAQAITKAASERPDLYQRYHERRLAEIREAERRV
jgi:hypothetical protein